MKYLLELLEQGKAPNKTENGENSENTGKTSHSEHPLVSSELDKLLPIPVYGLPFEMRKEHKLQLSKEFKEFIQLLKTTKEQILRNYSNDNEFIMSLKKFIDGIKKGEDSLGEFNLETKYIPKADLQSIIYLVQNIYGRPGWAWSTIQHPGSDDQKYSWAIEGNKDWNLRSDNIRPVLPLD